MPSSAMQPKRCIGSRSPLTQVSPASPGSNAIRCSHHCAAILISSAFSIRAVQASKRRDYDMRTDFSMIFRSLPALEKQRAVGAAEAEGIRQGVLQFGLLGVVGDEVQGVALRVGIIQVDGRRKA